jgi:hypothetical protein
MLVFLIIGFLYNLRRIADFMGGTGVYDIDNNLDRTLFGGREVSIQKSGARMDSKHGMTRQFKIA